MDKKWWFVLYIFVRTLNVIKYSWNVGAEDLEDANNLLYCKLVSRGIRSISRSSKRHQIARGVCRLMLTRTYASVWESEWYMVLKKYGVVWLFFHSELKISRIKFLTIYSNLYDWIYDFIIFLSCIYLSFDWLHW